jgi:hypothetical protein
MCKSFDDALKNVRGLSNPSLDGEMRMAFFNFHFAEAYKSIIRCNKIFLEFTQKAKNVHQYKHWIEEVAKHNKYDKFTCNVFNEDREPRVEVTIKKKQMGFGHCLVCVEYYWNIVYGMRTLVFGAKKEFEFASCGRDLRSIAEMMNAFHHERLSKAWSMIYG